jgi:hypothetical protein
LDDGTDPFLSVGKTKWLTYPFHAKSFCTGKRIKCAKAFLFLLSFFFFAVKQTNCSFQQNRQKLEKLCKSLTIVQRIPDSCRRRITIRRPGNARGEGEPAVGFKSTGAKMKECIREVTAETSFNSSEL